MADGSAARIADIEVGDKIVAATPETGVSAVEVVTAVHVNDDLELADVTVTDDQGRREVIHTTQNHEFWDATTNQWTPAGDLESGHRLNALHGYVTVDEVRTFTKPQRMYNLTVDRTHTYYVLAGDTPVLVHNCGTATVTFDGGHASVRVESGGEVISTHQAGGLVRLPDGTSIPTPIQVEPYTGTPSAGARSVTFDLPNPGGAMAYQEVMLGRGPTGKYDEFTASCFHHCARVLEAGGVPGVPVHGTTKDIVAFLLRASRGG
jgi:hypothetical protein